MSFRGRGKKKAKTEKQMDGIKSGTEPGTDQEQNGKSHQKEQPVRHKQGGHF